MRITEHLRRTLQTLRTAALSGAFPTLAAVLAVGALIACGLIDGQLIANAADGGAIGFEVSASAQRGALAYWTAARMSATAPKGIPTAEKFGGVPTVGALFSTTGGKSHFCTASVVDSAAGDLVITAAHCVYGKSGYATNVEYVPGYHDGERPYGTWAVRTITVASGWRQSQDPDLDVAFLAVGPASGARIQARTGGLTLGTDGGYAEAIEPVGYNNTDDEPVRCQTHSFEFRAGQLKFYCHDFQNGTSGGPWIAGFNASTGTGTVIGVIGGYEQGGDYDWASYSPYFGSAVRSLFQQAGGDSGAAKAQPKTTVRGVRQRAAAWMSIAPVGAVAPVGAAARVAPAAGATASGATATGRGTVAATAAAAPTSGGDAAAAGRSRERRFYRTFVPYISPRGSARSSRRTPSGSRKYMDVWLASWYGTPAAFSLPRR
jgi:V8-like Glu-specific endopeptidase